MSTVFKKIIDKEIPAEIIYEDDLCIVINDKFPKAPVHLLMIPKKEIPSMKEVGEEDKDLITHLIFVANKLAKEKKLEGYRLQFNVGQKGGQEIFHLHLHLMGWL